MTVLNLMRKHLLVGLLLVAMYLSVLPSAAIARSSSAPNAQQDVESQESLDPTISDGDLYDPSIPDLVDGAPAQTEIIEVRPVESEVTAAEANAAAINMWYGTNQTFGATGVPQEQVNILGNVSGTAPFTLTYRLNGGAISPLSVGGQPDVGNDPGDNSSNPRLAAEGDFNIDIPLSSLNAGANTVQLSLVDDEGTSDSISVTVNKQTGNIWPLPSTTSWETASSVTDEALVVDGLWSLDGNTVTTSQIGYDRGLAVGDIDPSWSEYEVRVPFTVKSVDLDPMLPGNGAGVGMIVRWQGHYDLDGEQPDLGWRRLGALGWYRWRPEDGSVSTGLELRGHTGQWMGTDNTTTLVFNTQYVMKLSVQVSPDPGTPAYYRFKLWPAASPEPALWNIERVGIVGEPTSGSVLLLAHNADVSFGNVSVTPLSSINSTISVSTSGIGTVAVSPIQATYTYGQRVTLIPDSGEGQEFAGWTGDITSLGVDPDDRLVFNVTKDTSVTANFQPATPKTLTVNVVGDGTVTRFPDKPTYSYNELVTLTAIPGEGQGLVGWSGDVEGNVNPITIRMKTNKVVTATFEEGAGSSTPPPVSDDFNACELDTTLWTFINPAGGTYALDGRTLILTVPGGAEHSPWGEDGAANPRNNSVRVVQPADDVNFVLEAKFDSLLDPATRNQIQGMLIEDDAGKFLRFEFFSSAMPGNEELNEPAKLKAFAGYFNGASGSSRLNKDIIAPADDEAMYIRIVRADATWEMFYSYDGVDWTSVGSFTQSLAVSSAGVYAGNDNEDPEHVAVVDYFFNNGAPIIPEDNGAMSLAVNVEGQGSVGLNPDETEYACGDQIQLTATPDTGWLFQGWAGALSGATNPQTLSFAPGVSVTAKFKEDDTAPTTYSLSAQIVPSNGGSVTKTPDKDAYSENEQVVLTAVAEPGWRFAGWSGAIAGDQNPYTLEMTDNAVVVAFFTRVTEYTLQVSPVGQGTVALSPDQATYQAGDTVTLTATPAEGWQFKEWTGDATGTANPLVYEMQFNSSVVAGFEEVASGNDVYLPYVARE